MTERDTMAAQDRAGRQYWDQVWQRSALPEAFDPRQRTRHNRVSRALHDYFVAHFAGRSAGTKLLEIGAARSFWLPYFAKEFGFAVTGLDYSEIGCAQARAILEREEIAGRVVHADFTTPPEEMLGSFDIVVSFGVIEHFENTAAIVGSLTKYLSPNGLLVSVIPNMTGAVGWLQKRLCRSIFDVHHPLDRRALRLAHEQAGLHVLACRYFLGGGFTSLNLTCWSKSRSYAAIRRVPQVLSAPFWLLERIGVPVRPNRITSPYVVCLAQAQATTGPRQATGASGREASRA